MNKKYLLLKISLLSFKNLYYLSLENTRFFLLKLSNRFFYIPLFFDLKKKNNDLFLKFKTEKSSKVSLDYYANSFLYWFKSCNKKVKKKLILKGLGFRFYLSDDKTIIFFKIGLSHIVSLKIPKKIFSVVIEKNFLIFEAYDNVVLGNFCKRIKRLKKVDMYKNKGFFSKNENISLKLIKKS